MKFLENVNKNMQGIGYNNQPQNKHLKLGY